MIFLREHLHSTNYEWATGFSHSRDNSEPDRRLFDRFNGNQVLFLINYWGQSIGQFNISDGRRIEELISNQLPLEVKSEKSVFNWLRGIYL
jgi:hypothetical protein